MNVIPSAKRASKITLNPPIAIVYHDNEFKFNSKNARIQNQGMLHKILKAFLCKTVNFDGESLIEIEPPGKLAMALAVASCQNRSQVGR
jgi:transketolase N-terminal domain/subunit